MILDVASITRQRVRARFPGQISNRVLFLRRHIAYAFIRIHHSAKIFSYFLVLKGLTNLSADNVFFSLKKIGIVGAILQIVSRAMIITGMKMEIYSE